MTYHRAVTPGSSRDTYPVGYREGYESGLIEGRGNRDFWIEQWQTVRRALPNDPWIEEPDPDAMGYSVIACYACHYRYERAHTDDCKWVAARAAIESQP